MYTHRKYLDTFEIHELTNGENWMRICPERGGILTHLGINNQELFYLDKETFYDKNTNIRGGNPILFPICGQLIDGKYKWNGIEYEMKNHGFARNMAWEVTHVETRETNALITLVLHSTSETKESYPFDFRLVFTYELHANGVTIHQEYENQSEEEMPMYAGFHPYFATKEKNLSYGIDATHYLDYNDMIDKKFEGILDLSHMVESVAMLGMDKMDIAFQPPEYMRPIRIECGYGYRLFQIWSVIGKEFVCVEPWMGLTHAMHHKEQLTIVQPKQSLKTFVRILH